MTFRLKSFPDQGFSSDVWELRPQQGYELLWQVSVPGAEVHLDGAACGGFVESREDFPAGLSAVLPSNAGERGEECYKRRVKSVERVNSEKSDSEE